MLDVLAVARVLIEKGPLAWLPYAQKQAILLLIALHDCGKISTAFRRQIRDGYQPGRWARHAALSQKLMTIHKSLLMEVLSAKKYPMQYLRDAVCGHHGGPVAPPPDRSRGDDATMQRDAIGDEAIALFPEVFAQIHRLLPDASLAGLKGREAQDISCLVSGLTTFADWLGSNEAIFSPTPAMDIDAYWEIAQERARIAIAGAGLLASRPLGPDESKILDQPPRPMQIKAGEVDLPRGPTLVLMEDSTGSGKTEAAFLLAQRMMAAGKGSGIYFALPTMATSNKMFSRTRGMMKRLFDGVPSLALMHGQRGIHEGFRQISGATGEKPSDASCSAWIASDRRKSLFAEIGVGTIDQALLGVLPTKFHTLRQYALANKIIIVDEAHAYDPYMQEELSRLLHFHAMFGGSAIVMTATLPRAMRDAFSTAFAEGLGEDPAPPTSMDYPLLTVQTGARVSEYPVDPVPDFSGPSDMRDAKDRVVPVRRLPGAEAGIDALIEAQRKGAACLWVRNAVDDAIEAVDMLRARGIDAELVDLLHARFAMGDRLDGEDRAELYFGKDSTPEVRRGRVLVATQVVEASLDLDFDFMMSDLAPVGSLIQRVGRLWRHERAWRPLAERIFYVVSPDPDAVIDEQWLFQTGTAGAWVYAHDDQWRTARAIFGAGEIRAPGVWGQGGLRDLVEAVHGDLAPPIPAPLLEAERKRLDERDQHVAQARDNLLLPDQPFGSDQHAYDDQEFPTRLGAETVTLTLMREEDGQLRPWIESEDYLRALSMSEVRVSQNMFRRHGLAERGEDPRIMATTAGWSRAIRDRRRIVVVDRGGVLGENLCYSVDTGVHKVG